MESIRTYEEEDALTQRLIFSPIRRSKPSRNQQKTAANYYILEAIAAARQDGRTAWLKFVVRKDDLKQVLEAIRDGRSSASAASVLAVSLDQRLNLLRCRQILRGPIHGRDRSWKSWRPVLQRIPEE